MAKFANVFNLKNNEQVLITINYNDEEDIYEIEQRTDCLGMVMKMNLGYDTIEKAEDTLNKYNIDDAYNFMKIIKGLAS